MGRLIGPAPLLANSAPDPIIGTHFFPAMVKGLGVLGWGVGAGDEEDGRRSRERDLQGDLPVGALGTRLPIGGRGVHRWLDITGGLIFEARCGGVRVDRRMVRGQAGRDLCGVASPVSDVAKL